MHALCLSHSSACVLHDTRTVTSCAAKPASCRPGAHFDTRRGHETEFTEGKEISRVAVTDWLHKDGEKCWDAFFWCCEREERWWFLSPSGVFADMKTGFVWVSRAIKPSRSLPGDLLRVCVWVRTFLCVYVPNWSCVQAHGPVRMLQMVRTLAQFSIALEEMNEHGEKEGGGGERDGGGAGGEDVVDRDAVDQFRNNNRNGNSSGNLNGNGSSNGEVDLFSCFWC